MIEVKISSNLEIKAALWGRRFSLVIIKSVTIKIDLWAMAR